MVEKRQRETMPQRVVENAILKLRKKQLLLRKIAVEERQAPQSLVNNHPKKSEFRAFFKRSNLSESQFQSSKLHLSLDV